MKRKSQTIFCPYCGKPAILRKASDIYKRTPLKNISMPAVITLPVMLMWVSTEEHYFQKGASLIKSFVGNALWPTVILILSGSTES